METDNVWFDSVECTRTVQRRGRIGGGRVVVRVRRDENAKKKKWHEVEREGEQSPQEEQSFIICDESSHHELGAQIESPRCERTAYPAVDGGVVPGVFGRGGGRR